VGVDAAGDSSSMLSPPPSGANMLCARTDERPERERPAPLHFDITQDRWALHLFTGRSPCPAQGACGATADGNAQTAKRTGCSRRPMLRTSSRPRPVGCTGDREIS